MKHNKIAIIGAGSVGATTAFTLMIKNIAAEIMLIDVNDARCKGEILDLSDVLSFCTTSTIRMATLQEAQNADIIIFCAGVPQKPGQPRSELLAINQNIVSSVLAQMCPINNNTILIMVTNPVDILTRTAQLSCNLPHTQVFGTGTFLDSLRFCGTIARHLNIAEESVHGYILGEHGDSQFAAWSSVYVNGTSINYFAQFDRSLRNKIEHETRQKAYEIIACKGATFYGIATCIAAMCESIIFNQKRILPLSTYHSDLGVCLSLPIILGEKGIEEKTIFTDLSDIEYQLLIQSAQAIKKI